MGEDVLLSTSDSVPTKKIVALIGEVSAKKVMIMGENPDKCYKELKKKAREMGANAIINVTYYPSGRHGTHGEAKGLAVKVEDAIAETPEGVPPKPSANMKYCPKCGATMPPDSLYCPKCAHKQPET